MKKWYQWLYLSLGFALGGVLNYFDGKQIVASVLQVSITLILAFLQFICDKKGETGKKVFKYVSIFTTIVLAFWFLFLILRVFAKG